MRQGRKLEAPGGDTKMGLQVAVINLEFLLMVLQADHDLSLDDIYAGMGTSQKEVNKFQALEKAFLERNDVEVKRILDDIETQVTN